MGVFCRQCNKTFQPVDACVCVFFTRFFFQEVSCSKNMSIRIPVSQITENRVLDLYSSHLTSQSRDQHLPWISVDAIGY